MAGVFQSLLVICLLAQAFAYRTCRVYHNHGTTVTELKTLLLFGLFLGIIFCWWYKAYKYRQRTTIVHRNVMPMQVVQPYPPRGSMFPNGPKPPSYPPYSYAFAPPPYSVAMSQGSAPPPPPNYAPAEAPKPQ